MMDIDDERPAARPTLVVGEDLGKLSLAELEARVGRLREEIARVEAAIAAKSGVMSAADALFRR